MLNALLTAADDVTRADGVAPLNEATLMAVRHGDHLRLLEFDGVRAVLATERPIELFVHPEVRRRGYATAMIKGLLERGERQFWAHGDLPAARALASRVGLIAARTLLVLSTEEPVLGASELSGVSIRRFEAADIDAILAVNARAFADHPEQGAMNRADFQRRCAEDWFDPEGLFVAEAAGEVVGFHWTKRVGDIGEVYVVGVDPAQAGRGLGSALTARGLEHLKESGATQFELYVESDNLAALAVYTKLGFTEHARDTLYVRP